MELGTNPTIRKPIRTIAREESQDRLHQLNVLKVRIRRMLPALACAAFLGCGIAAPASTALRPRLLYGPNVALPDSVRDYPIRAGMSAAEVAAVLGKTIYSSRTYLDLHSMGQGNAWSGYYTIEWQRGQVDKVYFWRGSLSQVSGQWILSDSVPARNP